MLSRRVDLPSGGYLMIDYAEALTVIDVNTGSFTGKGKAARLEDTITKTNLEAADEVVNQLRLRDIGGIIVIDFIDMARARNRDAVLKTLRKALDEDRTKTFVVEISPLGLVEMTRQNVTDGVREIMTKTCPVCGGEGVVKSEETMAIDVARHLRELVREAGADGPEAYLVRLNSRVTAWFTADGARELQALEERDGPLLPLQGSEGLPLDHFSIVMEGTRDEVAEQAVPFRAGEEVHVDIIEPHMYNPDDGGRQGRRLHHLRDQRRVVRRREEAGAHRRGAPHDRDRLARGRRGVEAAAAAAEERAKEREKAADRARRSAAAKRGAREPEGQGGGEGGRGGGRGARQLGRAGRRHRAGGGRGRRESREAALPARRAGAVASEGAAPTSLPRRPPRRVRRSPRRRRPRTTR